MNSIRPVLKSVLLFVGNEAPGLPNPTNVEDVLSNFEARVELDFRKGILLRDDIVHGCYVRHLKRTLEEYSVGCGLIQLRSSGGNREENGDSQDFQLPQSSNHENATLLGDDPQFPLQTQRTKEASFVSNASGNGFLGGEFEVMDQWNSSCSSTSGMSVPISSFCHTEQSQLQSTLFEPTLDDQSLPSVNLNKDLNENPHKEIDGYGFNAETSDSWGLSASSQPEKDRNYYMDNDLLADILRMENEMPAATRSWKDGQRNGRLFLW